MSKTLKYKAEILNTTRTVKICINGDVVDRTFDILFFLPQSSILFSLALKFLTLMQQMVVITRMGKRKMLPSMGMMTCSGLAEGSIFKKLF